MSKRDRRSDRLQRELKHSGLGGNINFPTEEEVNELLDQQEESSE